MRAMRRFWGDNVVKISGGLAVLLLVAAEEKVCPWFVSPPSATRKTTNSAASGTTAPPAPVEKPTPTKSAPLTVLSALPDAVLARWPGGPNRALPAETEAWHDGTVARGPVQPPPAERPAAAERPLPSWLRFHILFPAVAATVPLTDWSPACDPALRSVLQRTGPPRG